MQSDPASIRLDVSRSRLVILWRDGHESTYAGSYLRFSCPCALCRGHAPGEVEPPTWEACRDVRILGGTGVGAYGLRFEFSDGHDTGIYSFEQLRAACPSTRPDLAAGGLPRDDGASSAAP